MFVKCIDNDGLEDYLTVGKMYEVLGEWKDGQPHYQILDDDGVVWEYPSELFRVLPKEDKK